MIRVLHECDTFRWIDLSRPTPDELAAAQREFQLHPIFLQDCLEPDHLPKIERLGSMLFFILRLYDEESVDNADSLRDLTRKIAFFVGTDFIVTVHRIDPDQFQALTERCFLLAGDRKQGADSQLAMIIMTLINSAFESFQVPLRRAEASLDLFEIALFNKSASTHDLKDVHIVRRQTSLMKRVFIHSQDVVQKLNLTNEQTAPLYQDLRENLTSLIFLSDELLEDTTSLLNLQISLSAQKTNDVMRALTMVSIFFMPLTFIVGIYGMNFKYMPEIDWKYGYSATWAVMILVTIGIALWFRHKGWLKLD